MKCVKYSKIVIYFIKFSCLENNFKNKTISQLYNLLSLDFFYNIIIILSAFFL